MPDSNDFFQDLQAAKDEFLRVITGPEPGTFEDYLKRLETLHATVIRRLDPRSPQQITLEWVALASDAYFALRGKIIEAYRRHAFTPDESGHPRALARRLYRALATSQRRVGALNSLLLLSRITWLCELLRRKPDQFPLELALVEASRHSPDLVLPHARALCRWGTFSERFQALAAQVVDRFRAHSLETVDLQCLIEALRFDADAARIQIEAGSPVTHEVVISKYEQLIEFLAGPVSLPWRLSPLNRYVPHLSLSGIVKTLASHDLRIESEDDGMMTTFLRVDPTQMKYLFTEADGIRYVVVLPSTDCFFDGFPTSKDISLFESNPAAFLLDRLSWIPRSGTLHDLRAQVAALRNEQRAINTSHALAVASVGAASAATSRALAKSIGAPDEVVDLIEPFVLAVLAKALMPGKEPD